MPLAPYLLRHQWEIPAPPQSECLAGGTLHIDRAAHQVNNVLGDGHTKAGALHLVGAGAFLAGKGVKKGLLVGLAHANAVILHHKAVSGVVLVSGQLVHLKPDMPAGGRILDCVGENIHQHPIQTVGVCQHIFVLQMGVYRKGLAALACLLVAVGWLLVLLLWIQNSGLFLPANQAAQACQKAAQDVLPGMTAETFDETQLDSLCRYALFAAPDSSEVLATNMDAGHLQRAMENQQGKTRWHFGYTQYYMTSKLQDGTVCLLQFDYAVPYADPALRGVLPDMQTVHCILGILLLDRGSGVEHPQDRALPDPGDRKADRRRAGGGAEGSGQRRVFRCEGAGVRERFAGIADHGR